MSSEMYEVTVKIPATSANMGPGFDCLGMSLRLYNEIRAVVMKEPGLEIAVSGEGAESLPKDESNLVYQTMLNFSQMTNKSLPGLQLFMHNEIPCTRGLGSSATAIVGGLVLANELLQTGWSREQLLSVANEMEGHPDNVAPALLGGVVIAGISPSDGQLFFHKFQLPDHIGALVAIPDYEISTDKSRSALPVKIPRLDGVFSVCQIGMMIASLAKGDFATFTRFTEDKLHEPYRLPLMPALIDAISVAKTEGASCVTLSGSGPTILALFDDHLNQAAIKQNVEKAWRSVFASAHVSVQIIELLPDIDGYLVSSCKKIS